MINMPKPDFIQPMLCTLVDEPFDKAGWFFEPKWDGYRAIADIQKGRVRLYSRNKQSFVDDYPPVVVSLQKIKKNIVCDGEIVVLDEKENPNFQMLQNWRRDGSGILTYVIFDLLYMDGKSVMDKPLSERKKLLKAALPTLSHIQYGDYIEEKGA